MKPRVYLETSIFSYLVGWLNPRDLRVASNQQLTREWWMKQRHEFELFASRIVVDEAAKGDVARAADRLALLDEVAIFRAMPGDYDLADELVRCTGIPENAKLDALHIAIATTNDIDYLLTWNCKHIANARILPLVYSVCRDAGYEPPLICTPQELIEEPPHA